MLLILLAAAAVDDDAAAAVWHCVCAPALTVLRLCAGSPSGNPGHVERIEKGGLVTFACEEGLDGCGDKHNIYLDYADIGTTLDVGSVMMVDDGLLGASQPIQATDRLTD